MKLGRRMKIVCGVFAAVFLSGAVYGCHRNRSPEEKAAYIKEKVVDKLDLNDDQSKLLDDVSDYVLAWEKETRDLREQDRNFALSQITADQIDTEQVKAIYERKKAELDKRFPELLEKIATLHKSLTPEQKQDLKEFAEKMHKWRRH